VNSSEDCGLLSVAQLLLNWAVTGTITSASLLTGTTPSLLILTKLNKATNKNNRRTKQRHKKTTHLSGTYQLLRALLIQIAVVIVLYM